MIKPKTMHEEYGEPKDKIGNHLCCPECGYCITCGDCDCKLRKKWVKYGFMNLKEIKEQKKGRTKK